MSSWCCFGASITVPAGGWRYAFSDSAGRDSAILASGSYSSVWSLAADLDSKMDTAGGTFRVSTCGGTNTGKLRISSASKWTTVFANCSSDLLSVLGVSADNTVSSYVLTPTSRPRWVWFPGLITLGPTRGEGLETDDGWVPEDVAVVGRAGSGASRVIGPSRQVHYRLVRFGWIGRSEREDMYRGPAMLEKAGRTKKLVWYPDRDTAIPTNVGTQGDAEENNQDSSCTYWLVAQNVPPKIERRPEHPDWFSVELNLNGEP
jgi:hypothetical protein